MDIVLLLVGGLALLIAGGEFLVRGSVRVAERMGLSPLFIGLTLVGFGTSTPELVTSVQAALVDSPGIAVGNIVGSNIANLLLILGVAALIHPIVVRSSALKRDGVIMVATAALLAAVSVVGMLDRWVGLLFISLLLAYLAYAYLQERTAPSEHTAAFERAAAVEGAVPHLHGRHSRSAAVDITIALGLVIGGLALVVLGGRLLVEGAVDLARGFGISETVIGLTIVAVGTSTPELATSIVAALRKHADVALGNILGSNIYNILGIGGVTALIAPTAVPPEIIRFDNLVMVGVSILVVAVAATGLRIGRREGALLVSAYAVYVAAIWPI